MAPAEDGVPPRGVLGQLHHPAGADREHHPATVPRANLVEQRLVHRHVGDAEIAGQELDVGERVPVAGGQDAPERRQVGHRLRQHVDPVGANLLEPLHVG
jgi:hypothetical protein